MLFTGGLAPVQGRSLISHLHGPPIDLDLNEVELAILGHGVACSLVLDKLLLGSLHLILCHLRMGNWKRRCYFYR